MRAVVLSRHGPPDVLAVGEIPSPRPGPGEVAVKVEAVGVNYAEVLSRKGLYGWAPPLPYVLGMEAAGEVAVVGDGVESPEPGRPVLVGAQSGAYAETVVVPAAQALPAPPWLEGEERAAFGVNHLTAWISLVEVARLRPADRVLVTAAGGGVGTAVVRIATAFGCRVLPMAGSDEKLERVAAMGAEDGVNYRRPGWRRRLAEAAGERGVDVAVEVVGGDVYRAVREVLAPFGRVVVAGYAGLDVRRWNPLSWWRAWQGVPRADVRRLMEGSHGVMSTHLGHLLSRPSRLRPAWDALVEFSSRHGLRPTVGATFSLEEVARAHRLIESRESFGKVVLRV